MLLRGESHKLSAKINRIVFSVVFAFLPVFALALIVYILHAGFGTGLKPASAATGINKMISYQAKMTDAAGITVPNGTYLLTIRIYDSASAGTCLYTASGTSCGAATSTPVTVTNGIFSVMIGDTTSQNALTLDFNSDTYYLGIQVGNDSEMTPRKRIGAAGYAINSSALGGYDSANYTLPMKEFWQGYKNDWRYQLYDENNSGRVSGIGRIKSPLALYNIDYSPAYMNGVVPLVGDVDGDKKNEIAFVKKVSGISTLVIYDGETGVLETSLVLNSSGITVDLEALADLNGDGILDFIVGNYTLKAISGADLSILWTNASHTYSSKTVAVSDVNDDGKPEVVTSDYDSPRHEFMVNGQTGVDIWSVEITGTNYPGQLIADINGDGSKEVVFTAHNSPGERVYALDKNGTQLWTFEMNTYGNSAPIVADFDNDGKLEIFVLGDETAFLLDAVTGQQKWSYSTGADSAFPSSPYGFTTEASYADINNDGIIEILFGIKGNSTGGNGGLYALRGTDGSVAWKKSYTSSDYYLGVWATPVIVDIDDDGQLDVFFSYSVYNGSAFTDAHLVVFDGNGNQKFTYDDVTSPTLFSNITVADVNNDGLLEIVIMNSSGRKITVLYDSNTASQSFDRAHVTDNISKSLSLGGGTVRGGVVLTNNPYYSLGAPTSTSLLTISATSSDRINIVMGDGSTTTTLGFATSTYIYTHPARDLAGYSAFTVNTTGTLANANLLSIRNNGVQVVGISPTTSTFAYGANLATSGGNVGIGTSTPQQKLSVDGDGFMQRLALGNDRMGFGSNYEILHVFQNYNQSDITDYVPNAIETHARFIGTADASGVMSAIVALAQVSSAYRLGLSRGVYGASTVITNGGSIGSALGTEGFAGITNGVSNASIDQAIGIEGNAFNEGSTNDTIGSAIGVFASTYTVVGGQIDDAFGIYVASTTAFAQWGLSGGTILRNYGIEIGDITGGTEFNYALYSGRGLVSFGDKVGIGTTGPSDLLTVSATSTPNTLNIVLGNGSVTSTIGFATSTYIYAHPARDLAGYSAFTINTTSTLANASLFTIRNNGTAVLSVGPSTSTFAGGIQLNGGCVLVNGACIGGGSSQWTTLGSGIYYNTGNVGIGTSTPAAKLTVVNGGMLFSGNVGATPVSSTGTRMMWIPAKAAFRAGNIDTDGYLSGAEWNDANIGNYSVAMGLDTVASDEAAFAMGEYTSATAYTSIAMGYQSSVSGNYSVALGNGHAVTGYDSLALGNAMIVNGNKSVGIGLDIGSPHYTINSDNTMAIMGGKVGIATTSPAQTLDVVGNIANLTQSGSGAAKVSTVALDGATALAVSGKYAYVVDSEMISVVDVSDPAFPKKISVTEMSIGSASAIYIAGRYAYIGSSNSGDAYISIVDISNPYLPALIATSTVRPGPGSVYVAGKYAYTANWYDESISIVDISNPYSPKQVATTSIGVGSNPSSIVVSGRYAYVADAGNNKVAVLDVSNPLAPALLNTASVGTSPYSIYVSGRYAYTANGGSGTNNMSVVDISNPALPVQVGTVSIGTGLGPNSIFVSGRYAYMANSAVGANSVSIIDVASSTAPMEIMKVDIANRPNSIYVSGHYAYVTNFIVNSVSIIDISGTEVTSLIAHSAEVGNLQSRNDIIAQGNIIAGTSLGVGAGGIMSGGALSVGSGTSTFVGKLDVGSVGSPARPLFHIDSDTGEVMIATTTNPFRGALGSSRLVIDDAGTTIGTLIIGNSNSGTFDFAIVNSDLSKVIAMGMGGNNLISGDTALSGTKSDNSDRRGIGITISNNMTRAAGYSSNIYGANIEAKASSTAQMDNFYGIKSSASLYATSAATSTYGIYSTAGTDGLYSSSSTAIYGVYGRGGVSGGNADRTYGGYFESSGGSVGYGIYATANATGYSGYFAGAPIGLAQISAPVPATDKLYNVSGALWWNGTNLSGGVLPAGTTNYTVRYNGAAWVATDALTVDAAGNTTSTGVFTASGAGTSTISGKLGVNDRLTANNTVLFTGTNGSTPVGGSGTRFMWIPAKGAIRAGTVSAYPDAWDDANIGTESVAFGDGGRATGTYAITLGQNNDAGAQAAFAAGAGNAAYGQFSVALGGLNTAIGASSFAAGSNTSSTANYATSFGFNSTAGGAASFVAGYESKALGDGSIAFAGGTARGYNSFAAGLGSTSTEMYSFAFGNNAAARGVNGFAAGDHSGALGNYSVALGAYNYANGQNSVALGQQMTVTGSGSFGINLSGTQTVSANNVFAVTGGNVGIASSSPTYLLSMESNNAGGYYSVSDSQFHNGSTRSIKQDITPITDEQRDALLTMLGDLQITRYHFINDVKENGDNAIWQYGIIADDSPELLSGKNHDGIGTGSAIQFLITTAQTLNWKLQALEQGWKVSTSTLQLFTSSTIFSDNAGTSTLMGNLAVGGTITQECGEGCVDIAETFNSSELVEAGDVVMIDTTSGDSVAQSQLTIGDRGTNSSEPLVRKTSGGYASNIIGIVSTNPAITLTGSQTIIGGNGVSETMNPPVALAGRVPVKVTDENGPVKAGDLLVSSSSTPGAAMKYNQKSQIPMTNDQLPAIIGMALTSFDYQNNQRGLEPEKNKEFQIEVYSVTGEAGIQTVHQGKVLTLIKNNYIQSSGISADGLGLSVTDDGKILSTRDLDMGGKSISNVKSIASESGNWSIDENGYLKAKIVEAEEFVVNNDNGDSTVGIGHFNGGQKEVLVENVRVKKSSKIFVSFLGNPGGTYWISETEDGWFKVELSVSAITDVDFNYWILGVTTTDLPSTDSTDSPVSITDLSPADSTDDQSLTAAAAAELVAPESPQSDSVPGDSVAPSEPVTETTETTLP